MSQTLEKIAVLILSVQLLKADINYRITAYNCATSKDSFVKLLDVSLEECVEACVRRQTCRSVGYRQRMNFCELHKEDVSVPQEAGDACVFVERKDMDTADADKCSCSHVGHVCNLNTGQCNIEECGQLNLTNGKVYGNQYYVGAKLQVSCVKGYAERRGIKQAVCNNTGEWDPTPACDAEEIAATLTTVLLTDTTQPSSTATQTTTTDTTQQSSTATQAATTDSTQPSSTATQATTTGTTQPSSTATQTETTDTIQPSSTATQTETTDTIQPSSTATQTKTTDTIQPSFTATDIATESTSTTCSSDLIFSGVTTSTELDLSANGTCVLNLHQNYTADALKIQLILNTEVEYINSSEFELDSTNLPAYNITMKNKQDMDLGNRTAWFYIKRTFVASPNMTSTSTSTEYPSTTRRTYSGQNTGVMSPGKCYFPC